MSATRYLAESREGKLGELAVKWMVETRRQIESFSKVVSEIRSVR